MWWRDWDGRTGEEVSQRSHRRGVGDPAATLPPPKPGGRPRTVNIREVINGIFYVARGGIPWRFLPKDFPPWQTVYYFWVWRREGVLEGMNAVLREKERVRKGREATPSTGIIDSQSAKTTEKGGLVATTAAKG